MRIAPRRLAPRRLAPRRLAPRRLAPRRLAPRRLANDEPITIAACGILSACGILIACAAAFNAHAAIAASDRAVAAPLRAEAARPSLSADELHARAQRAAEDLRRGREILARSKGSRRIRDAAAAFTSVIDALSPYAELLAPGDRLVAAGALEARAQCRILQGRRGDADADLVRLLSVDPSYEPDPASTPTKALERFRRAQETTLAWITVQPDPPEANIVWNGREVPRDDPPERRVLSGPFVVEARMPCYGSVTIEGTAVAGERRVVPVHLDPIARSVRFETAPPGFDVEIDGTLAGRTAPAPPPAPRPPPELLENEGDGSAAPGAVGADLERGPTEVRATERSAADVGADIGVLEVPCVLAGEHAFVLARECYEEARGVVLVDIDFADLSAVAVPRLAPVKKEVLLTLDSDVPGATVLIDGAPAGATPLEALALCPGRKAIEVRAQRRLVWADTVALEHVGPVRVAVRARPTLRIAVRTLGKRREEAGREETDPIARIRERASRLEAFNRAPARPPEDDDAVIDSLDRARPKSPDRGGKDAARQDRGDEESALRDRDDPLRSGQDPGALRERWGADLLLAVDAVTPPHGPSVRLRLAAAMDAGESEPETTVCALNDEECPGAFFEMLESPWPPQAPLTGLVVSAPPGAPGPIVVSVRGPAAAARIQEGDRLVEAAGTRLSGAGSVAEAVEGALGDRSTAEVPIVLERAGQRRQTSLAVRRAPVVPAPGTASVPEARILAQAELEASVLPPGEPRNAALLNLAAIMISRGRPRRALDLALERTGWADGVSGAAARGAARFLAARCYAMLGEPERAREAYRQAAADEGASFWMPDGLAVAPLARIVLLASAASRSE